ncbi:MAG: hypothetical protein RIB03_02785 [Henriciella sp.]|uniref:hypothetical protein n=1 Tax=Henriciella sp. TaxID=1968823 RepID=UPI0032EAB69E
MKLYWLAPAALALIAACGSDETETPTLFSNCVTVMSDPELSRELAEASTSPDAACTCLQAHVKEDEDTKRMLGIFFSDLASAMQASGESAEDLAGRLIARSMLPDEGSDDPTFADAMPVFNNVFEELLSDIEENDGACPAV